MNMTNNYRIKKKVQTAEERKWADVEKVKKSAHKRKDLATLKDEKDGEKVKKKEKKVRKV